MLLEFLLSGSSEDCLLQDQNLQKVATTHLIKQYHRVSKSYNRIRLTTYQIKPYFPTLKKFGR